MASVAYRLPDMGGPHPLGRHVNHDERSRDYPFMARPEAAATIKTVSWQRRVPIFDQGSLGSCTGNAAAGWIGTDDALRQALTSTAGAPVDETLAIAIYSAATTLDPWAGQYPPTDTGSDGLSVAKVLKARGLIGSYTHGFSVTELLVALQSTPVLIGIPWLEGMFTPDANGFVTPSGSKAGGHELEVLAYDDTDKYVVAPNSWGTGWGEDGYCKFRLAALADLLADDGDVTVPHALVAAPTPPLPPSPPEGFFQWLEDHANLLGAAIIEFFERHWPHKDA